MESFFNAAAQLSNVLPTGTFLVFQVLAPLATNNGNCGVSEKVVTSIMLVVLSVLCCVSCFTDSYTDANRVLHPGFVRRGGLWNRTFSSAAFVSANVGNVQGSTYTGNNMYKRSYADFVNAGVSVAALATFTLLTAPVITCFYPHIAGSIVKTVPLLVGLLVSAICPFTNFRHGFGFSSSPAVAPAVLAAPTGPPGPLGPANPTTPPASTTPTGPQGAANPTTPPGSGNSAAPESSGDSHTAVDVPESSGDSHTAVDVPESSGDSHTAVDVRGT